MTKPKTSIIQTAIMTGLLALAGTATASHAPFECTTNGAGNWTVLASGPIAVTCPGGGDCTAIQYQILANNGRTPDHVAILADHDVTIVVPESRDVAAPCVGDNVTLIGIHDCARQAVRMNREADTGFFRLAGMGNQIPKTHSIVIKKGKVVEECAIVSLGFPEGTFDPNAQVTTTQELKFKNCTVSIPTNPTTGEGGIATISGPGCVFVANGAPVSSGELMVNGKNVGPITFGEGSVSSGLSSCTTKIISRKLYTWCTCEDINGDGVPDDPIPPCPATVP